MIGTIRRHHLDRVTIAQLSTANVLDVSASRLLKSKIPEIDIQYQTTGSGSEVPVRMTHALELLLIGEEEIELARLMARQGCPCVGSALGKPGSAHIMWQQPSRIDVRQAASSRGASQAVLKMKTSVYEPAIWVSQNLLAGIPYAGAYWSPDDDVPTPDVRAALVADGTLWTIDAKSNRIRRHVGTSTDIDASYPAQNYTQSQSFTPIPLDLTYDPEAGDVLYCVRDADYVVAIDATTGAQSMHSSNPNAGEAVVGISIDADGTVGSAGTLFYSGYDESVYYVRDESSYYSIPSGQVRGLAVSDGSFWLSIDEDAIRVDAAAPDEVSQGAYAGGRKVHGLSTGAGAKIFAAARDFDYVLVNENGGGFFEREYPLGSSSVLLPDGSAWDGPAWHRADAPGEQHRTLGYQGVPMETTMVLPVPGAELILEDADGALTALDWNSVPTNGSALSELSGDGKLTGIGFEDLMWQLRTRVDSSTRAPRLTVQDPGRARGARFGGVTGAQCTSVFVPQWSPAFTSFSVNAEPGDSLSISALGLDEVTFYWKGEGVQSEGNDSYVYSTPYDGEVFIVTTRGFGTATSLEIGSAVDTPAAPVLIDDLTVWPFTTFSFRIGDTYLRTASVAKLPDASGWPSDPITLRDVVPASSSVPPLPVADVLFEVLDNVDGAFLDGVALSDLKQGTRIVWDVGIWWEVASGPIQEMPDTLIDVGNSMAAVAHADYGDLSLLSAQHWSTLARMHWEGPPKETSILRWSDPTGSLGNVTDWSAFQLLLLRGPWMPVKDVERMLSAFATIASDVSEDGATPRVGASGMAPWRYATGTYFALDTASGRFNFTPELQPGQTYTITESDSTQHIGTVRIVQYNSKASIEVAGRADRTAVAVDEDLSSINWQGAYLNLDDGTTVPILHGTAGGAAADVATLEANGFTIQS